MKKLAEDPRLDSPLIRGLFSDVRIPQGNYTDWISWVTSRFRNNNKDKSSSPEVEHYLLETVHNKTT